MMRSMKRSLALATSLALLSTGASAQRLPDVSEPCAPELLTNRRAVLEHEGAAGIWFHMDVARCMLGRLSALPQYMERVRLLDERLRLGDGRVQLLHRQVALAEEAERRSSESLETAVRGAREARESLDGERRRRWLWFGVGVVLTVVVQALAVWAWTSVSD